MVGPGRSLHFRILKFPLDGSHGRSTPGGGRRALREHRCSARSGELLHRWRGVDPGSYGDPVGWRSGSRWVAEFYGLWYHLVI